MKETILAAKKSGRCAIIPFITAGFPSQNAFWETLAQVDASGADIIEIGIPFSDPVADGPVIEDISRRALAQNMTLDWVIEGLRSRKGSFRSKLVLMGYMNPFVQYGLERLAADCAAVGVSGFIVPDLPLEETPEFREAIAPHGLTLITLVGPNTTTERMKQYAPYSQEYVYIVSVLGTTGGVNEHVEAVADTIRRARSVFDVPLALGFGLRVPEQLDALPSDARPDAAVIGTALLQHIRNGGSPAAFLAPWLNKQGMAVESHA